MSLSESPAGKIKVFMGILFFSIVLNTGRGQEPAPVLLKSGAKVQIHKLTIDANNLPNGERERITRSFEHSIFTFEGELQQEFKDELWERIRQAFRDLGYFKARVDEPKLSLLRRTQRPTDVVDVSVKVDQGVEYRLGDIRFVRAAVFPADRMRPLFQLQPGDLFAVTTFSKGLDNLRQLYATEGYINCVVTPVPQINESHRTIDLVLDIDDGKPFDFGRLFLNATEPHPGAYKALMESWKTLQGKRYSPLLLKSWLTANASEWPGSRDLDRIVDYLQHPESHTVDIKLQLQ
jgi:outer membrane translocation and assembly module TamA